MRPEFVNRINEIVVFHTLSQQRIAGIARIQLRYLEKRLARLDMALEVSDAALTSLAEAGFDLLFSARPLSGQYRSASRIRCLRTSLMVSSAPRIHLRWGCQKGS